MKIYFNTNGIKYLDVHETSFKVMGGKGKDIDLFESVYVKPYTPKVGEELIITFNKKELKENCTWTRFNCTIKEIISNNKNY